MGIGPEIIIRYLKNHEDFQEDIPVVLGDISVLRRSAEAQSAELDFVPWEPGNKITDGTFPVISVTSLDPTNLQWGKPTRETGHAMAQYIEEAVRLCLDRTFAAMVTCPITKSALNNAGYNFPGHTEMIASICNSTEYAMMMAGSSLRVTLVTIHKALAEVPGTLTQSSVESLIRLTGKSLQVDFGIPRPRIAVSGLNPHAGEEGMFGEEEKNIIIPAVSASAQDDWDILGPFPPDTVFNMAAAGKYDAVVCMYHDQGLIPFKLLHFKDGVNVTIGLPIIRTSVDHGTAYDIAGKGIASFESLKAAFMLAGEIAGNRKKYTKKVNL